MKFWKIPSEENFSYCQNSMQKNEFFEVFASFTVSADFLYPPRVFSTCPRKLFEWKNSGTPRFPPKKFLSQYWDSKRSQLSYFSRVLVSKISQRFSPYSTRENFFEFSSYKRIKGKKCGCDPKSVRRLSHAQFMTSFAQLNFFPLTESFWPINENMLITNI